MATFVRPLFSLAILLVLAVPAFAGDAGFVGDGRCGNPLCHGAALQPGDREAKPWKSARTQWLNRDFDRHSRAYATLETGAAKAIAGYMAIEATTSDKCLVCHAPGAQPAAKTSYERSDGVTCEHCHGAAEQWLEAHVQKDWRDKRASYVERGFYDLHNPLQRAEKCATCHLAIDHEIVAGGHPPLQFEMVSYGRLIRHWDDETADEPTLWSIGQLVGLVRSAQMVAQRAGQSDYQGIGNFAHFKDRNCYQCHHKLVEDGLRQAQGHYEMVSSALSVTAPQQRNDLMAHWNALSSAAAVSAEATQQRAQQLIDALEPQQRRMVERPVTAAEARQILSAITIGGERWMTIRRLHEQRPIGSNTTTIENIGLPRWYTTGAPEQSILAIEALCEPSFAGKCSLDEGGIGPELRQLLSATDRSAYDQTAYSRALTALHRKLFP